MEKKRQNLSLVEAWLVQNKQKIKFVFAAIGLFLLFRYILMFVLPFILAFFMAQLLNPLVHTLERKTGIKKGIWVVLFLILLTAAGMSLLLWVGYGLSGRFVFLWNQKDSYLKVIEGALDQMSNWMEQLFHLPKGYLLLQMKNWFSGTGEKLQMDIMQKFCSASCHICGSVACFLGAFLTFFIATILITAERDILQQKALGIYRFCRKIMYFFRVYLWAQLRIMLVILLICLFGFLLSGIKGAFGLAFLTAFLDVLPFIGTGLVLVPMAVFQIISGQYGKGAILGAAYFLCIISREYLEPKLISREIGISPILTLAGIYIGIQVFGIAGIVSGPLYFLLITFLYREIFCDS